MVVLGVAGGDSTRSYALQSLGFLLCQVSTDDAPEAGYDCLDSTTTCSPRQLAIVNRSEFCWRSSKESRERVVAP